MQVDESVTEEAVHTFLEAMEDFSKDTGMTVREATVDVPKRKLQALLDALAGLFVVDEITPKPGEPGGVPPLDITPGADYRVRFHRNGRARKGN